VASLLEDVGTAEAALRRAVEHLEPGTLDVVAAKDLVDVLTRCERLAVAGRGRVARRVQEAVTWARTEHRSASHWLASATGVSVGAATRSLETARDLEGLPETAAAFAAGELSEAQASEIAATAVLDPSAERRLLETARGGSSFKSLRDECRDTAGRVEDDTTRARRLHETRAAYSWTERDGAWRLDVRLAPDQGAKVAAALSAETDELFRRARAAGRLEPRAALAADALVTLLSGETLAKPIEVRLEADLVALERGYVEPGERCHLVGVGPVPVTTARSLLDDARVCILSREGADISRITTPKRTVPAHVRRWVERAYPTCGVASCQAHEHLQIDHIVPIAVSGPTTKTNLWRLCVHHHRLKTLYAWQVVGPPGNRQLLPPDQERAPP